MGMVKLDAIRKDFGIVPVLRDIDLEIEKGEFVVFVGPSGSGKSTLLRIIAGLETPTDGDVFINGQDVTFAEPSERGIAMVFQSYALYPHMDVAGNMAFNLRISRMSRAEIDARVREAARILQLDHLLSRKPSELSGGQRQRVAIGRAIVRHPQVFLFDEPLSNLDAALRVEMRLEIERLHRELGTTMIYVTHDQVEAMTLADRIVVLDNGTVQQIGAPMDLYREPANRFVAEFIGSPRMNVLACDVLGHRPVPEAEHLGIRPEDFSVAPGTQVPGQIGIPATVRVIERLGGISFGYFQTHTNDQIVVQLPGETALEGGQSTTLGFDPAHAHCFAKDGTTLTHRRT